MLSTQAIFLLAATMFGGVAQVEAGGMIDLSAGLPWRRMLARRQRAKFRVLMRPRRRIQRSRRRVPNRYNRFRARCLTATMCRQPYPRRMPAMTNCHWPHSGSKSDRRAAAGDLSQRHGERAEEPAAGHIHRNSRGCRDGTAAELAAQSTARRGDKPDPRGKGPAIRIQRRQAVIGRSFLPPGAGRHPVAVLLMKAATTANSAGR